MSVTIYHNPRCSKSRKSLELLEQHAQQTQVIEYLKTPPDAATIRMLLQMLGMKARDLLRTNEEAYTQAGLDDMSLDENAIIAAMVKYPTLIERPIVVMGNHAVLGRPPERVLELIGKHNA